MTDGISVNNVNLIRESTMSAIVILREIIEIVGVIRNRVNLVKKNQVELQRLLRKVERIVCALQGLKLVDSQRYIASLLALKAQLEVAVKLIENINKMGILERVVCGGTHESKIEECNNRILELLPELHVGLTAQQLEDTEEDRLNYARDRAREQQELLTALNNNFRELQKTQLNLQDIEQIMAKQMASVVERVTAASLPVSREVVEPKKSFLPGYLLVDFFDLIIERRILESDTGNLYHGKWRRDAVTIKMLEHLDTDVAHQQFMREIKVMSRLRHDHIMPLRGACIEKGRLCFVSSVIERGHLGGILTDLSLEERILIAQDLAKGLMYLHDEKIVHGDIRPESVGVNRYSQAKWMNFGLVQTNVMSLTSIRRTQDVRWQAPELWQFGKQLTPASDVYSFGLLLWTLMTQRLPYEDMTEHRTIERVGAGRRPETPSDTPMKELIEACWRHDEHTRPKLYEIVDRLEASRLASPDGETLYESGIAAHKAGDVISARDYYKRACEKKFIKGFTSLGMLMFDGIGGEAVNKPKGIKYLTHAAKKGHVRAMYCLADAYEKSDVPEYAVSLSWYQKVLAKDPMDMKCRRKVDELTTILEAPSEQLYVSMRK